MEKNKIWIICFIILLMGVIICYLITSKKENIHDEYIEIDTVYNKVILDSIEYNIIKKDSIIYNIKQEMKDEVTKSFNLNDSSAIELFKELAREN